MKKENAYYEGNLYNEGGASVGLYICMANKNDNQRE